MTKFYPVLVCVYTTHSRDLSSAILLFNGRIVQKDVALEAKNSCVEHNSCVIHKKVCLLKDVISFPQAFFTNLFHSIVKHEHALGVHVFFYLCFLSHFHSALTEL